jgi:hypothetical protein
VDVDEQKHYRLEGWEGFSFDVCVCCSLREPLQRFCLSRTRACGAATTVRVLLLLAYH